jgi:hypothetical protein
MCVFLKEGITDGCESVYRYRNARVGPVLKLFEFHSLNRNAIDPLLEVDGVFHFVIYPK